MDALFSTMHPILFHWGPITLHWYGLFVAIGFLAAYHLFLRRAERAGLSPHDAANLVVLLFVSGILGARAYYVILKWRTDFAQNPLEILMIQHGGLVFFGGFLFASFCLVLWARWKRQSLPRLADTLAPSLAIGHFFGRLGCFMNGCCYGRPSDLPWAVCLNSPSTVAGVSIHPTQLYEALGLIDIFVALLVIERLARYPGQVFWSYCILYSVLRFIVEFYRGDVPHTWFMGWTFAQVLSVGIFFVAWVCSSLSAYRTARNRIHAAGKSFSPENETPVDQEIHGGR